MSKSKILYLFTRTPLHVGAGASVGAIDQPIVRERHTGFPIIPGTSLKGVLRDAASRDNETKQHVNDMFGEGFGSGSDNFSAGKISFGEAKLLAFPVRSAKGSFAFATCPLARVDCRARSGLVRQYESAPILGDLHKPPVPSTRPEQKA
ncbi:MAG: type III-B CRISPR module RAMP protein Cmr4 [Verrucomicrobiota bacterium]|jgi:CRISPR-associated protein Cmr4